MLRQLWVKTILAYIASSYGSTKLLLYRLYICPITVMYPFFTAPKNISGLHWLGINIKSIMHRCRFVREFLTVVYRLL